MKLSRIKCFFLGHSWYTCIYDKDKKEWIYWCESCGVDK